MPEDIGSILYLVLFFSLAPFSFLSVIFVIRWFMNPVKELHEAAQVDAIWEQRDVWGEEVCRRLIAAEIEPTMTSEMVRLAWGEPESVTTQDKGHETWHYPSAQERFVDFKDNQVTQVIGSHEQNKPLMGLKVIGAILAGLLLLIFAIIFTILGIYLL